MYFIYWHWPYAYLKLSTFISRLTPDIKLPDDNAESLRDVISPELRMNKYMMEHKYELGTSIAETSDFHSTEPKGKVALGESLAETGEYIPSVQNGVTTITTAAHECAENGCHQSQIETCHHPHHPVHSTQGQIFAWVENTLSSLYS